MAHTEGRIDRRASGWHRINRVVRSAAKPKATAGASSITKATTAATVTFCMTNYLNRIFAIRSQADFEQRSFKIRHALHAALSVECYPRTSSRTVAKSILVVANRNLLRRENAADWPVGILGIYLAGAQEFVAVSKVDSGNGALRPSQA